VEVVVRSAAGAYEEHAVNKESSVHRHNPRRVWTDGSLVILNTGFASRNERYAMATYSSGKPRRGENNLVKEIIRIQLAETFRATTHFHIAP
jgi:hypothetical protein